MKWEPYFLKVPKDSGSVAAEKGLLKILEIIHSYSLIHSVLLPLILGDFLPSKVIFGDDDAKDNS